MHRSKPSQFKFATVYQYKQLWKHKDSCSSIMREGERVGSWAQEVEGCWALMSLGLLKGRWVYSFVCCLAIVDI